MHLALKVILCCRSQVSCTVLKDNFTKMVHTGPLHKSFESGMAVHMATCHCTSADLGNITNEQVFTVQTCNVSPKLSIIVACSCTTHRILIATDLLLRILASVKVLNKLCTDS